MTLFRAIRGNMSQKKIPECTTHTVSSTAKAKEGEGLGVGGPGGGVAKIKWRSESMKNVKEN